MHPTQKGILLMLMHQDKPSSFSELLPEEMKFESYNFNYHLKHLIKEGFLEKQSNKYRLTKAGLQFISMLTSKGNEPTKFKVSVALIVTRHIQNRKEILLQRRLRHPFFNDINSIAGKVLEGEKVLAAAKRKLLEESGLDADFKFLGTLRKCRLDENNNVLEDTFYNYCITENPKGELVELNEFGENFWINVESLEEVLQNSIDISQEDIELLFKIINEDYSQFFIEEMRNIVSYTSSK